MSRTGKNPVVIPAGVTVSVKDKTVTAKGKLGELSLNLVDEINVEVDGDKVVVSKADASKTAALMWGTTRSNIQNLVTGVAEGFTKELEINGVGYRAQVKGKDLVLQLGFSHEVVFPIPEGINIKCEKPTAISISGANKQAVGQVAAKIREYRKPEPYKGKGVKYVGEYIVRKEGKKK